MVNGGIDKARVQLARDALLKRGERITINAIRAELGNTGSRTTILRYLQELNRQDALQHAPSAQEASPAREEDDLTERMTVLARTAVAVADEQHALVNQLKGLVNQQAGHLAFLANMNQQLNDRTLNAEFKYLQMRSEAEALQQLVRDRGQQGDRLQATLVEAQAALRQLKAELATLHRSGESATA